jgi:chorismate mutase / prephenate dehydratase
MSDQSPPPLSQTRQEIDRIDEQLIRLLNERAEHVLRIGEIKKQQGLDIYVPGREEALLKKLCQINDKLSGKLTERAIRAIFREVMSAALALEDSLKIAYLGPVGSWTHQVAVHKFGNSVTYVPEATIEGVFTRVSQREVDYGVLPIEHSTEGAVHHTLDHLVGSPLTIYAQMLWQLETVIMAPESTTEPSAIYGHPQMLASCRRWLTQSFPRARLLESASASLAATHAETEQSTAAIGTALTAELHGLRVLASSPREHATRARFIILGHRSGAPSGQDHTMLLIQASDRVGALVEVLQVFATQQIQVRQIENRPSLPGQDQQAARFYLEVSGHQDEPALQTVLQQLQQQGSHAQVLGSYPAPSWVEER